jgi:hypothetical protein
VDRKRTCIKSIIDIGVAVAVEEDGSVPVPEYADQNELSANS